jgi:Na+-driven multidrug efflux pump
VDARYIKEMLWNPDISPSASINRWILAILMFYFTLVHIPGTHHTPNGLSRQNINQVAKKSQKTILKIGSTTLIDFLIFSTHTLLSTTTLPQLHQLHYM